MVGVEKELKKMIEGLYSITITPIMKDRYTYQLLDLLWDSQTPENVSTPGFGRTLLLSFENESRALVAA